MIGAAVAFNCHTVHAEKHSTIIRPRIEALAQHLESRAGEQIARTRHQRALEGIPDITAVQARRTLRRFQRNIAGKSIGYDNIDGPGREPIRL